MVPTFFPDTQFFTTTNGLFLCVLASKHDTYAPFFCSFSIFFGVVCGFCLCTRLKKDQRRKLLVHCDTTGESNSARSFALALHTRTGGFFIFWERRNLRKSAGLSWDSGGTAHFYGAERCVAFVGWFLVSVSCLGTIFGAGISVSFCLASRELCPSGWD